MDSMGGLLLESTVRSVPRDRATQFDIKVGGGLKGPRLPSFFFV
jgi:hypothetical protein